MSLKITTEAQAQAARKKLDVLEEYAKAFNLPFCWACNDIPGSAEEVSLRNAISAYEAERELENIELSEEDIARMHVIYSDEPGDLKRYGFVTSCTYVDHIQELRKFRTDKGRAYLARRKPTSITMLGDFVNDTHIQEKPCRGLRWEVWNKEWPGCEPVCVCPSESNAQAFCSFANKNWKFTYEVREVRS